tara:strand:+ start:368 stop:610 length:243 start_codon:yes stop_codon:yes gene_type:complete
MFPNQNLSKADAQWLLKELKPLVGGSIRGKNISIYTKAVNLIRGTNLPNPGCACEYKTKALVAQSLFGQYKTAIEEIANS